MTHKEQKVVEAMKAVKEAEEALFNALFDIREVEEAVEASSRANEMYSTMMQFKYSRKDVLA